MHLICVLVWDSFVDCYISPQIGNDDILTELIEGGRADDDELPTLHEALSPKSTHVRTTDLPTVTTVLPTVRDDVGSSVERKVETSVDFEGTVLVYILTEAETCDSVSVHPHVCSGLPTSLCSLFWVPLTVASG